MRAYVEQSIRKALAAFSVEPEIVTVEHPAELSHGDYATNVALLHASKVGRSPREFAEMLLPELMKDKGDFIETIEVAGPGFINFRLSPKFFEENIKVILDKWDAYGKNTEFSGQKIMIEYTDPNPFKEFHIGHLMSNAIGETLSRIFGFSGAEVKRVNYQGDVGLHVAKALWGLETFKGPRLTPQELGKAYTRGAQAYEEDENATRAIQEINKKIYDKSDMELMKLYEEGKRISLVYFESIYQRLGTHFDYYFFESDTGVHGKEAVERLTGTIFEKSEGATVFRGEKYGLHTRVFLTKDGYPTYEAKELGLAFMKYEVYKYDRAVVVTGNEIVDYYKVFLKALELIYPDLAFKTVHVPHGMLRLPTGKMSSRTGDVITAESLLEEAEKKVLPKVKENREIDHREQEELARVVAVGAIKYSILKQAIGNDIIFDWESSLSFEGNSGPYLQYTYARAESVLRNAPEDLLSASRNFTVFEVGNLSRLLYRFPEIVERAGREHAPHYIATYLFDIAQAFNAFYAQEKIIEGAEMAPYRVALTKATALVIKNGLYLLGIKAPERM